MGSVARLLKEYDFEVTGLRRGRYEVKSHDGSWTQAFGSDNELWSWAYVLVMDSTRFALGGPSSVPALGSGSA